MAIDYRKEWKRLRSHFGNYKIDNKINRGVKLHTLMDDQIQEIIGKREALMKEYIKEEVTTDIYGANKTFHFVKIDTQWGTFGNICISKKDFVDWCEKRGGKV